MVLSRVESLYKLLWPIVVMQWFEQVVTSKLYRGTFTTKQLIKYSWKWNSMWTITKNEQSFDTKIIWDVIAYTLLDRMCSSSINNIVCVCVFLRSNTIVEITLVFFCFDNFLPSQSNGKLRWRIDWKTRSYPNRISSPWKPRKEVSPTSNNMI